jgi:hypothetical protein
MQIAKEKTGGVYAIALATTNDVQGTKWEELIERLHHNFKKVICPITFIDLLKALDCDDDPIWVCPSRDFLS